MAEMTIIEHADDAQVAEWLGLRIAAALARSTEVALALPGGSTPFPILQLLVARPLDWRRVTVFPTDDRVVPEDHPASNTGKLRALLEPAGVTVQSLDGIVGCASTPALPRFSLVWLGMGADGHIASLFPNTDPRRDDPQPVRRLTPDPLPPEAPFDRITLTIPALLDSDELLLVARGADKRPVLDAAVAGESDLPIARLLGAAQQPVTCFT